MRVPPVSFVLPKISAAPRVTEATTTGDVDEKSAGVTVSALGTTCTCSESPGESCAHEQAVRAGFAHQLLEHLGLALGGAVRAGRDAPLLHADVPLHRVA